MGTRAGRRRKTLANRAEFREVFREGRVARRHRVVIHLLQRQDCEVGRYGLVVSKKVGGAVQRNQARRRLRAAIELAGGIPRGMDAVVVVKPNGPVRVKDTAADIVAVIKELPGRAGH